MSNNEQSSPRLVNLTRELPVTLEEAAVGKIESLNIPHREMCDMCGGTGQSWRDEGTCPHCDKGWVKRQKALEVRIPAGVETGTQLRIKGVGDLDESSMLRGDLYIKIVVARHKQFERRGRHLYTSVPVTQEQMRDGAEIIVPTLLDGRKQLHIPPGTVSGTAFRLEGLGVRSIESSERGDLFVKAGVYYAPTETTPVSSTSPPGTSIGGGSSNRKKVLAGAAVVLVVAAVVAVNYRGGRGPAVPNQNTHIQPSPTVSASPRVTPRVTYPLPSPVPSRTPFSLPNGSNITPPQGPRGDNTLKIINSGYFDVAVKIVNSSTQKTRRFVYVRAGSTAVIKNLAREVCLLRIMSGRDWDAQTRKFLSDRSFYEFDKTFDLRKIRYTVSLEPSLMGTLKDLPISEEDFEDK